jgi:uncharacterized cupin superfamily protein
MSDAILVATVANVDLDPAPINPRWIISGKPEARAKLVAKSHDKLASKVVWECTPGVFEWHYDDDETVYVIAGEATLVSNDGKERSFGPGDMVFFPAGSRCTWHVTKTVRKFAILRQSLPGPVSLAVRAVGKLVRMIKGGHQPWS